MFLETIPNPFLTLLILFRVQVVPNAPRPLLPVAQVHPPFGYTDIDKSERRINNNLKKMINPTMEKRIRMMTNKFS